MQVLISVDEYAVVFVARLVPIYNRLAAAEAVITGRQRRADLILGIIRPVLFTGMSAAGTRSFFDGRLELQRGLDWIWDGPLILPLRFGQCDKNEDGREKQTAKTG